MRLAAAAVVSCSLVALAACGGSSSAGGNGGKVTLTIWNTGYSGDPVKTWNKVDAEFERTHPNVKVKQVSVADSDMPDKLRAAVAARQGPDIVTLYPGTYSATFRTGLVDLKSKLTPEQRKNILLIDPSVAPDGALYSLPQNAYGYVWMYNKKLFARAGLDPGSPPKTWDEFLATCGALQRAHIAPVASGWQDGVLLEWFMYVFGDQLLSPAEQQAWFHGTLPVNNPKFAKVIDYVMQMKQKGCFQPGGNGRAANDTLTEFARGHAAMLMFWISSGGATGSPSRTSEAALGKANVGAFLPPLVPGATFDHPIMDTGPGSGLAITKFSSHQKEAWNYVSYNTSAKVQEELFTGAGNLPVNKLANVSASGDDPVVADVLRYLKTPGNYTIYMGFTPPVLDILHAQTPPILDGKAQGRSVLGQMQQKQEQVIAPLRQ